MLVHLCLSVLLTVTSPIVILHCYLWANKMVMMMMWEVGRGTFLHSPFLITNPDQQWNDPRSGPQLNAGGPLRDGQRNNDFVTLTFDLQTVQGCVTAWGNVSTEYKSRTTSFSSVELRPGHY